MGTVRQRNHDEDNNWVDNLLGRAKGFIGFSSCPSDESDGTVKDVANSIECQPIKTDDVTDKRCAVTYTDLVAPPAAPTWLVTPGAIVAIIVALLSISLSGIMWLTSAYDNAILKLVSIRDDIDMVFDLWRLPPTRPTLSVYPFHYTNYEAVIAGSELPNVEEKGPFIFREKTERININFYGNSTVSFQEMKNITHDDIHSRGSLKEKITTPNVPLIVFLKKASGFYFLEQKFSNAWFNTLKAEPFHTVTINDLMWGYEDDFFKTLSSIFVSFGYPKPKPFGFLAKRKGVHHDIFTERTGADDLNTIGSITRVNGVETIGAWGNTTCDLLQGSDGTIFPAKSVRNGETLYVFSKEMCRRIPIFFNNTQESKDGFPVQRYDVDPNMYNFSGKNKANECYLLDGEYPPSGSFLTSPCQGDAPIYFTFPHFLHAGEELKNSISGLHPDPEKHRSYIQIHKELGISMRVRTRFQLNVMLKKSNYIAQSSRLKAEKLILPIAWMDYDSGDLPEDFVNTVYHLTFTVKWVEALLRWTLSLCAIASVIYLTMGIRRNYRFRVPRII